MDDICDDKTELSEPPECSFGNKSEYSHFGDKEANNIDLDSFETKIVCEVDDDDDSSDSMSSECEDSDTEGNVPLSTNNMPVDPDYCFSVIDEDDTINMSEESSLIAAGNVKMEEVEQPIIEPPSVGSEFYHDLPQGWITVNHKSGLPLYYHEESNICTTSRPYRISDGLVKSHNIKKSSFPCMRFLHSTADNLEKNSQNTNQDIKEYCSRLFCFKKIRYLKFRSWDVRRTYTRSLRHERKQKQRSTLGSKAISIPIYKWDSEKEQMISEDWVINPREKSFVAILHEYLQQSLKTQPKYRFEEGENAKTPFSATVIINGTEYGTGTGKSKKDAKLKAAKNTMEVLLPNFRDTIQVAYQCSIRQPSSNDNITTPQLVTSSVLDNISMTHPQVLMISKHTSTLTPYEILTRCLSLKYGNNPQQPKINYVMSGNECTLSVGERSVTVTCNNKREGKEKAAQRLLQILHPYITNWGSLLRLYGDVQFNNRKTEVAEVSDEDLLEYKDHGPNLELMSTLKERMLQLRKSLEAGKS